MAKVTTRAAKASLTTIN